MLFNQHEVNERAQLYISTIQHIGALLYAKKLFINVRYITLKVLPNSKSVTQRWKYLTKKV